ncbi:helix-turn-helix domain-containing protein [Sulfuriferula sp.]|uniref:helix-turn-helix domain-containing protein n=1 Tax=Sulfuriferula sp. TaxID=2025307 RepID=UPI002730E7EA|nr:helix-turn-helix domain-containing protein [Sulfuriferula sp.]MDP2025871.1 helix-turn-helix domain-containing protein [Sulfuriferula sp.]
MTNQATHFAGIIRPKNPDLIDESEAAEILDVSPGTLSVWRSTGRYALPFVKVGRKVRYSRTVLNAWLDGRTRTTGATK